MAKAITARSGNVSATVTGDLADMEREILDLVAPEVRKEFEATARKVVEAARKEWPVRTGESRDSFQIKTRLRPEYIETVITNEARSVTGFPYPYTIKFSMWLRSEIRRRAKSEKQRRYLERAHGKGTSRPALLGKRPWQSLIAAPMRKQEEPLARRLSADLNRLER